MELKGNKIFITGGAGFIGAKIIERLVDNNSLVVYDTLQRNSLEHYDYSEHKNLSIIEGDILNLSKVIDSMDGCNIVIHLAAIAGIDSVIRSPTSTMKVNMIGSYNVLEASLHHNIEKFINFSTSEVYGQYAYKLGEGDNTTSGIVGKSRWTYATSKLAAEHLAMGYYSEFGLPVISVRPFNIYGPGQIGEGAIHNFIKQALEGKDLKVVGDGDQIRSWCYIDDIVDAIILLLENDDNVIGEVFNIGNPKGTITILSLAEKIISISKSKSKIVFVPKNYTDVDVRIPSIDKATHHLGFVPKFGLDEGISKTLEWYSHEVKK